MKAMTVRQPWAWAIMHAGKDIENRTRNIAGSYRGPLIIHAGLAAFEQRNMASNAHRAAHGTETPTELHFGAALGIVDLVDSHEFHQCPLNPCSEHLRCMRAWYCSHWAEYAHHLVLANPRPFSNPIPYRGRLGLWEFPDDLIQEADGR